MVKRKQLEIQPLVARSLKAYHVEDNALKRDEIGPDLFRAACEMGLEGLVSKHRDRPYQSGRSKHWVKVKNRIKQFVLDGEAVVRGVDGVSDFQGQSCPTPRPSRGGHLRQPL